MTIHGLQPVLVKDKVDDRMQLEYEKWNTYSRIQVRYPWVDTPWLWSPSETLPTTYRVEQRSMNIDGDAGTVMFGFDGEPKDAAFLQYDVTNVAYRLRNTGKAAVIGVGGGRDVLSAWVSGFRDITAVELNPIFIDLLTTREPFASFAGLAVVPGIHFHIDEARSWFARTDKRFDLIQMSLIDTWAATGAGAYSLSENGLYTLQGWRRFVGALTPTGIFTVSRWFSPGDLDETGRMIALAVREVIDMGVSEPEAHIALVANGNLATLLLSRQPLTQAELGTLHQLADTLKFQLVLAPDMPAQSTLLQHIIRSKTPEQLDRLVSRLSVDLSPPTDDRPFFFKQLPLARAWTDALDWRKLYSSTGVKAGNLLASVTLLIILVLAMLFVITIVLVPLRSAIRAASARLAIAGSAYFVCLGLGFMFIEIGLLQRLSLFLGHPVYSLSIVLFGLVLATGIGSFLSEKLPLSSVVRVGIWSLLVSAYIVSLNFWVPAAFATIESSGIFIRGAAAVAVIVPAGLLMGFGFPSGMRMVLRQNPAPAPWFWGINGAAGVLGSIIAIALSITGGISTTFLAGSACYVALIPAAVFLQARSLESRKLRLSK